MFKRVRSFFKEYRNLGFVTVVMVIAGALDLAGKDTASQWLLGISALIATAPLMWEMWETIRLGRYGIDILAITAIVTAVILGENWAAIVVVLMLTGGKALEDYAEKRAKTELTSLLARKPKKAHVLKGTRTVDVAVSTIVKGDRLVILPGEVAPVDAIILEGGTSFDESSLTGESVPIVKDVGDQILSGAVNIDGAITVQALCSAADSQYEQIIKLVKSASASQSPFVRLADRYSIPFTVVSFIIAFSAWLISGDSSRFLEVLVVATPCPLILGAPIALISGMSRATKNGIIIKTGAALERLAEVQSIAFDKTGTLTHGAPVVAKVNTFNKFAEKDVLQYAAALEQGSGHVLAKAIVTAASNLPEAKSIKAKQVKEVAGKGLIGRLNGKTVLVGRMQLLEEHDVSIPKEYKESSIKRTATFIAIGNQLAGIITFNDTLRPEAKSMLARLRRAGIRHFAIVTGDNTPAAVAIAKEIEITDVYPECLPADKLRVVEQLRHRPVAFVGDGTNDAPVLTAADVGIALGAKGSTAASETADVVILLDDVSKVATAVEISKNTFAIARQSILIGVFISIGLMALFSTGRFKAVHGALAQEAVDIIVILNALRAHGSWRLKKPTLRAVKNN